MKEGLCQPALWPAKLGAGLIFILTTEGRNGTSDELETRCIDPPIFFKNTSWRSVHVQCFMFVALIVMFKSSSCVAVKLRIVNFVVTMLADFERSSSQVSDQSHPRRRVEEAP